MNEHLTINKKSNRLQKPVMQPNEEEEEKERLLASYSKQTQFGWERE